MRETGALLLRHLREAVRSGGARIALLVFVAALLLAVVGPAGASAGGTVLWAVLLAIALLGFVLAAACGSTLPSDRASGREEWLAAHAPPAVARRLAAVLGPAGGVLAGTFLAGLLAGVVVEASGRAGPLRRAQAVAVPSGARLLAPRGESTSPVRIPLGSVAHGRVLEVEAKPLFVSREALHAGSGDEGPLARVGWAAGGAEGEAAAPMRAPLRILLPARADDVTLVNRTPGLHLVVRAVRLLDPSPASPAVSLLWAALLVGLVAAALVPSAVLVSRWTTAPTAVATTLVLVLLGVVRPHLDDLAVPGGGGAHHHHHDGAEEEDPDDGEFLEEEALGLLRIASHVAPDLGGLSVLAEPAEGRTLGAGDLSRAGWPALHGAVVLLLVLLPGLPRRRA